MLSNYNNYIYTTNTEKSIFKHDEMVQRVVYFPGFERCDYRELIEKVGSGNPDEIQEFNRWVNEMRYLHNKNEPSWMVLYKEMEYLGGDYPDGESADHAHDIFTSNFQSLCRIVSFIFDPVEKENVKKFFQEQLNEYLVAVPV